jgi:hypothetical protein
LEYEGGVIVRGLPKLPVGIGTFEEIITGNCVYVDKTNYLAEMARAGEYYFISRPRRFGKSLTVSTLDALFSGREELFRGLSAENFFKRSDYWACPVIPFDFSRVSVENGVAEFERELGRQVVKNFERHSLAVSDAALDNPYSGMEDLLRNLLYSTGPAVVLIDDYDGPILDYVRRREDPSPARRVIGDFFGRIDDVLPKLRFVLVTGVTKFSPLGGLSAMNKLEDISKDARYAPMLGFTEDEIALYFEAHIDDAAESRGTCRSVMIESVRNYYGGYSFDGASRVYNPFSAISFLSEREFRGFWFDPASLLFLKDYIRTKQLTVEQFRGIDVSSDSVTASGEIEHAAAVYFLYQMGCLTLRPGRAHEFTLDYPNREVRVALSSLFVANILGSAAESDESRKRLKRCLLDGNAGGVTAEFNRVIAAAPYDNFERAARRAVRGLRLKIDAWEWLCRSTLLSYLIGMGLDVKASADPGEKYPDMIVKIPGRVWIIELDAAKDLTEADETAGSILGRLKDSGFADEYDNAVLLGLVLDDKRGSITAFASEIKGGGDALTDDADETRSEGGEESAGVPETGPVREE